jgi:hypothetical protein
MITPNPIHRHLASSRAEDIEREIPPTMPRLQGQELGSVASLLAGVAVLLLIAAPSL